MDLRPDWRRHPYISLWRPNNANYAWPLPWAGRYSKQIIDEHAAYYTRTDELKGSSFIRFPVPCSFIEALATAMPEPGLIDGNIGPVLINDAVTRAALRRARYASPDLASLNRG